MGKRTEKHTFKSYKHLSELLIQLHISWNVLSYNFLYKLKDSLLRKKKDVLLCAVLYLSHVMRKRIMPYANNKGADQSAHPHTLYCLYKGLKGKASIPTDDLIPNIPKLGVVEISTLWHFRLPFLIQMFIKVASSPRLSGIGMPSPIL